MTDLRGVAVFEAEKILGDTVGTNSAMKNYMSIYIYMSN